MSIDGELVILDDHGRPQWDRLRRRQQRLIPYRRITAARVKRGLVQPSAGRSFNPFLDTTLASRRSVRRAPLAQTLHAVRALTDDALYWLREICSEGRLHTWPPQHVLEELAELGLIIWRPGLIGATEAGHHVAAP